MEGPQIDGGFRVVGFAVGCNISVNAFLGIHFQEKSKIFCGVN